MSSVPPIDDASAGAHLQYGPQSATRFVLIPYPWLDLFFCSLSGATASIKSFIETIISDQIDVAINGLVKDALNEAKDKINIVQQETTNTLSDLNDQISETLQTNSETATAVEKLSSLEAVATEVGTVINSLATTHYMDHSVPICRWAYWHTHQHRSSWLIGNAADLYGGVNPSTWTDGNAQAYVG